MNSTELYERKRKILVADLGNVSPGGLEITVKTAENVKTDGLKSLEWYTMAFRGTDVKEFFCANSLCWHIDWAQFNWSQQKAR